MKATPNSSTVGKEAGNATVVQDGSATPSRQAKLAEHSLLALTVLCTVLGSLAAMITSTTFATALSLAPVAGDQWGLKLCAAVMRMLCLTGALIRAQDFGSTTWVQWLQLTARLLTAAAVEVSVLFSQPIFSTVAGGVFKPGDVAAQTALRMGRSAWLGTHSGILCLLVCLPIFVADKYKLLKKGYPRALCSAAAKMAKPVCTLCVFTRAKALVLWLFTSVDVLPYITALPTTVLMSRQELSIFWWSIDSSFAILLMVLGDLCMSNAAMPPPIGAGGAALLGAGLLLSGIPPSIGFAFNASAWAAAAACELLLPNPPPAKWLALKGPAASLEVALGGQSKSSSAKMTVRVAGWNTPIYRPLDKAMKMAFAAGVIAWKPSWALFALRYGCGALLTAVRFCYHGSRALYS